MSTLDDGHALFAVDAGPQKLGHAIVHLGVKLRAHRGDKIGYRVCARMRIPQDRRCGRGWSQILVAAMAACRCGHEEDCGMTPTCSRGSFLPVVCLLEMFIEDGMQPSSRISVRWPEQSCIISSS